jgi:DNA polymerase III epsilon subunit family exonuclease
VTAGARSPLIEHLFARVSPMAMARQAPFDDLGTPLSQVTFVVVDVETTGGSPARASLTEVAAARFRGGEQLGTYQTFVRPDERIPPFITALTGISDAMVADAPRVGEMLPSLLEFVGGSVLVGHNLRFDLSFLDHALVSTGRGPLDNRTVDTLALSRRLVRDEVDNCQLGTLAAALGLPHRPSHRALTDVLATGDLLHALLERAGSFGILDLAELLDLPRLLGHPQAAKLRLTVRLPHHQGVYWFTDAAGHVLYVGRAADLHARVRSTFGSDQPRMVGRLLRQLDAVHHRVCAGPLTASVVEGRLIRAWSPPFNQPAKVGRRSRGVFEGPGRGAGIPSRARRRRRRSWTAAQLATDPTQLLIPLAGTVSELSHQQRYEAAGAVRDEAEALRRLVDSHRRVTSLRDAGRVVLAIDGEGEVVLDGGLLVGAPQVVDLDGAGRRGGGPDQCRKEDGCERSMVAQWLGAHAGEVRIVEVESPQGWALPADRVPELAELVELADPCRSDGVRDPGARIGSAA